MSNDTRKKFLARASDALILHAGLVLLTRECLPGVEERLAKQICKRWKLSDRDFEKLAFCSWPSHVQNVIGVHALYEALGNRISLIPGVSFEQGFNPGEGFWRLDLDERYTNGGFLMPVRDSRGRWFCGLRAFRSVGDSLGFPVEVRRQAA